MSFSSASLAELQATMMGYSRPWWVAGGWGVDLHLGYQSREHADIEIAIPYDDQHKIREHIGEEANWQIAKNHQLVIWPNDRTLTLPIHEIHVKMASGFSFEILLNTFTDLEWIYRRDPRIRLARGQFPGGALAPLPPEIILLYKSKDRRSQDEQDFSVLVQCMNQRQRQWLRSALSLVDEEHPWIEQL